MSIKGLQEKSFFRYLVEILTLSFILGLIGGVFIGIFMGWEYFSIGFMSPAFLTIHSKVNEAVMVSSFVIVLYICVFALLRRGGIGNRFASLLSVGILLSPVFLYMGYILNKEYLPAISDAKSIIGNLLFGLGFIAVWGLISLGLFAWTRERVLPERVPKLKPLFWSFLLVAVFNASAFSLNFIPKNKEANIIIILIDALRADHLGSYGYHRKTTPNMDRFVEDSVVFRQAISQSTFTKTSIASLFTSLYPFQHGVYSGHEKGNDEGVSSHVLGESETTLAEVLLDQKFLTIGWVHNHHLRSYMGFGQGFVVYNDQEEDIKKINRNFINWIKQIGLWEKFFAYVHYIDVHEPYRPNAPYDTMFGVYSDIYSGIDFDNWGHYRKEILEGKRRFGTKEIDQLMAYYDGQLAYVDQEIGSLFDALKKLDTYDKSLIIVTSDHGDGFMEHGFISHSNVPYEELIRVPLIIKFPGSLYRGKVIENQVRLIDLMPTVLEFFQIRNEDKMEGKSLLEYIIPEQTAGYNGENANLAYSEFFSADGYTLTVRSQKYKYILLPDHGEEFYDLSADPLEKENIIELNNKEVEKFRKLSEQMILKRKSENVGKTKLDQETIDELKALGYISD